MVRGWDCCRVVGMFKKTANVLWSFRHDRGRCVVKPISPVFSGIAVAPVNPSQIVHDITAGQYHHATFAQGSQPRSEIDVVAHRLEGIQRQLHDRDVGLGKQMRENTPRTMVDAPLIAIKSDPIGLRQFNYLGGELRQARRRVLNWKSSSGKP